MRKLGIVKAYELQVMLYRSASVVMHLGSLSLLLFLLCDLFELPLLALRELSCLRASSFIRLFGRLDKYFCVCVPASSACFSTHLIATCCFVHEVPGNPKFCAFKTACNNGSSLSAAGFTTGLYGKCISTKGWPQKSFH